VRRVCVLASRGMPEVAVSVTLHSLQRVRAPHRCRHCRLLTQRSPWRYRHIMTGPWPHKPYTFRALQKTFGAMWVCCDLCRRYATLRLTGLLDVDYRTKRFSCSRCGSEAWVCVVEPVKELGMQDYRLDEIEDPQRHPVAVDRLTGKRPRRTVDRSGGELPGRKVDARR